MSHVGIAWHRALRKALAVIMVASATGIATLSPAAADEAPSQPIVQDPIVGVCEVDCEPAVDTQVKRGVWVTAPEAPEAPEVPETPAPAEPAPADAVPAQISEPVAPITDYANYPDAIPELFEPTCSVDGNGIVTGLLFDDGETTSDRFRNLTLENNESVTTSWTGFYPGCEHTMISFSVKRADSPVFDINEDQEITTTWVWCGTVETPCVAGANGRYSLTITMPPPNVACSWQADATIGPPLEVIGPSGSYYSPDIRTPGNKPYPNGKEMLLQAPGTGHNEGANNGGRDPSTCAGREGTADVQPTCAPGGFTIELGNDGDIETEFDVTVDGSLYEHAVVAPLDSQTIVVPAPEDSTHHVVVTAESGFGDDVTMITLFDDDVLVDCEQPAPPTLTFTASPDCDNDAPYLSYAATPANASPTTVTLHWYDAGDVERFTQADMPLSGRVPYPGVVLDAQGAPIDWPGWIKQADGTWVQGADGFQWVRPTVIVRASFNPTSEPVVVTFPPGNPHCHPANPEVESAASPPPATSNAGLVRTGTDTAAMTELGVMLIGTGSLLTLLSRPRRRRLPAR